MSRYTVKQNRPKAEPEIARNGVCNPNTNASYDLLARSTLKMQSLVNMANISGGDGETARHPW